jgi:hypothetical protein
MSSTYADLLKALQAQYADTISAQVIIQGAAEYAAMRSPAGLSFAADEDLGMISAYTSYQTRMGLGSFAFSIHRGADRLYLSLSSTIPLPERFAKSSLEDRVTNRRMIPLSEAGDPETLNQIVELAKYGVDHALAFERMR